MRRGSRAYTRLQGEVELLHQSLERASFKQGLHVVRGLDNIRNTPGVARDERDASPRQLKYAQWGILNE